MISYYSPLIHQHPLSFPDEIVEEVIKIAWAQRHMTRRWQFYRTMIGLCRQWQAITRMVSLRFVVLECPKDVRNYCRLILKAKEAIPDKDALEKFFSRTHIRADVAALGLSPIIPACKSLELTGEVAYRPRHDKRIVRLSQWLQIPGLKAVAFLHSFYYIGFDLRTTSPPPTLAYIHYHLRKDGLYGPQNLPSWLTECLGNVTHLRVSSPQSLLLFVGCAPKLEEIMIDLDGITDSCYTIVLALKAGLLLRPRKKIVLNTGPEEPACCSDVAETCQLLGITLERREYPDTESLVKNVKS